MMEKKDGPFLFLEVCYERSIQGYQNLQRRFFLPVGIDLVKMILNHNPLRDPAIDVQDISEELFRQNTAVKKCHASIIG
jgi:hypothetical protein